MHTRNKNPIRCPECGREEGLSLHISALEASITVPVLDGKMAAASELLLDPPLSSDEVLARYSDVSGSTRLVLHAEDIKVLIDCPKCERVFSLPEGIDIKCSDAE